MELRSRVFKVALATAVGLVAVMGSQEEGEALSAYTNLCDSAPSVCEFAPQTAPVLDSDVCFNGSTVKIKSGACPFGWWPYYVGAGEVIDPMTNEVQAYITLPDACDMGYCVTPNPEDPDGEAGAMCCDPSTGSCTETQSTCPPSQITVWCPNGHSATQQNGEWICVESE